MSVGEEKNAGRILAYQVSRSSLRWNSKPFHHFLAIPGHENCNVANAIFDRHGQLKRHLYGNFAAETNQGELLYIRDIQMKPRFKKQGLASLALKYLLRRLSQRQKDYGQPTEWWFAGLQQQLRRSFTSLHSCLPACDRTGCIQVHAVCTSSFFLSAMQAVRCHRGVSSVAPVFADAYRACLLTLASCTVICPNQRLTSHRFSF